MKKILYLFTLSCLALSAPYAIANEPEQPPRIELGKKQKKTKSAKEKAAAKAAKEKIVTKSAAPLPNMYHKYYKVIAIGAGGKTLSTDDETVWEISSSSSHTARRWSSGVPIIIQLNHSWFSHYAYCLKNTVTNESVSADLALGPFAHKAIFITDINPYRGDIRLSDNTYWTFGFWDGNSTNFKNWKVGQAVLIGETNNWWSPYHILININENNYIPVNKR